MIYKLQKNDNKFSFVLNIILIFTNVFLLILSPNKILIKLDFCLKVDTSSNTYNKFKNSEILKIKFSSISIIKPLIALVVVNSQIRATTENFSNNLYTNLFRTL